VSSGYRVRMSRLTDFGRQIALYFGLAEEVDAGSRRESPLANVGARLAAVAELVRRAARRP
jgi:hypothetical protein